MPSHIIESLIEELNAKFGDRPFYTLRQLIAINFFGSLPAARMALREGRLSFVKISPRRLLVPRSAVLDYLKKNLYESKGRKDEFY